MSFSDIKNDIRNQIIDYLHGISDEQIKFDIGVPPREDLGDLTTNLPIILSKMLKKSPVDVCKDLAGYFQVGQMNNYLESVESHPSGHLNFKINKNYFVTYILKNLFSWDQYLLKYFDFAKGSRIIIEHTSVNPNKAIHIGHLRNLIIGDTLYRLLLFTGHKVVVLNYIDDSGSQVADLIIGFKYAKFPLEPPDGIKYDHYCGDDVYVKVNNLYKSDTDLDSKRRYVLQELEKPESDVALFAKGITLRILKEQLKTCWRIKAHYDLLNFESQILSSKLWSKIFEILKDKGILQYETDGKNVNCWIAKKQGEEDKVIVRSDGTATYVAKDIPYAAWKVGLLPDPFYYYVFDNQWDNSNLWATTLDSSKGDPDHPDFTRAERIITIIDSRQQRLQNLIKEILSKLTNDNTSLVHLSYEPVAISSKSADLMGLELGDKKFIHMSGRSGIYINADDILDKLYLKAKEEIRSRKAVDDEEIDEVANALSISALRYQLIKQDYNKMIKFDIEDSLKLEGDTGPYLQYAYARAIRIIEKSNLDIDDILLPPSGFEQLTSFEFSLVKHISIFNEILNDCISSLSIKPLAYYSYRLASLFNLFYDNVPILRENENDIRLPRLCIVKSFLLIFQKALNIMGIDTIKRM